MSNLIQKLALNDERMGQVLRAAGYSFVLRGPGQWITVPPGQRSLASVGFEQTEAPSVQAFASEQEAMRDAGMTLLAMWDHVHPRWLYSAHEDHEVHLYEDEDRSYIIEVARGGDRCKPYITHTDLLEAFCAANGEMRKIIEQASQESAIADACEMAPH